MKKYKSQLFSRLVWKTHETSFATFTWEGADEATKIKPVLEQIAEYCEPRKSVPFERYRINKRTQEAGVLYDQYRAALRKLAEFSTITPEEI